MKKNQYDVIVIGAGHNGLVCAAYLAKAGYKVLALERRHIVGGAVVTEADLVDGFQLDTCSSYHVVIHGTPIVRELELEKFGLEYIEVDPWGFAPFPNGNHILFYRDVDRTAESIARFSTHDAEAYRRFMARWIEFNRTIMEVFCIPPTIEAISKLVWEQRIKAGNWRTLGNPLAVPAMLRTIFGSYGQEINRTFKSPEMRAAMAWLGAQSGPGPDEPMSGELMAMQQSLYHYLGVRRPKGGSGMLTQALARCLEHFGGEVKVSSPVRRILTSMDESRVSGVETEDGEQYYAPVVISNAHVQTTLLKLLSATALKPRLRRKVENIKVVNGFGMTVRYGMEHLPNYSARPTLDPATGEILAGEHHRGMQLLCPSMEYLKEVYAEAERGCPPTQPAVIAMTPSVVDSGLAPPGKHVMYIWAQNHPYRLANGENWADIRQREADQCLEVVEQFAPGIRDAVLGQYLKSPVDLEEINGLLRGNLMHVDMSIGQMFFWRPVRELANYRTPVQGLYLTGASTHPGGGVSGAPGYNTAQVVLSDLRTNRLERGNSSSAKEIAVGGVAAAATGLGIWAGRRKKE